MKAKRKIKSANLFPVVGVGASAGGLNAFKKLLGAIPVNSGMAYILVQHLDPTHDSLLPTILQRATKIPVIEITHGINVRPDHIYVLPSNKMMIANKEVLQISERIIKKNQKNLPIDIFFTSLAEVHQSHAVGIVLSGTASDGTAGLKAIKDNGGITLAQDEASAEYSGMPLSAIHAGVVDFMLAPEKMPQKLLEITNIINGKDRDGQNFPLQEDVFNQMLSLLRTSKGTDFSSYKKTTIRRRILRRMAINKNEEPYNYLKFLQEREAEQNILYQDLLIPVTSFFRDPEVFKNLTESLRQRFEKKTNDDIFRVWVAGCSSGQEAYSIAICLKEVASKKQVKVQIFASDLSEPAISKARSGIYTKAEIDSISPERVESYFLKTNNKYQINKDIRDMVVFAAHDFIKDPPFSKMDFVSCRNVLIYMDSYLQKKALNIFHFSLNSKGFLLLGKSETVGNVPELFDAPVKNDKLFVRRDVPRKFLNFESRRSENIFPHIDSKSKNVNLVADFQKAAEDIIINEFTPAAVIVNEFMDIVHFQGNTERYLIQRPGKPTHNIFKMAKQGFAFELRKVLLKTKKEQIRAIKENIIMDINGRQRNISIEAIPLVDIEQPHFLIVFSDNTLNIPPVLKTNNPEKSSFKTKILGDDLRIQQLEQELTESRQDMQAITESQESANERLQSVNEELLSSNEELQSLTEELESSAEELQSTNEELTVVNQETISLNKQLIEAREYAEAIVSNVIVPLLVLDANLRVKSANSSFYKTFAINDEETIGKLIYELGDREWDIPSLRNLLEKILPEKSILKDFEIAHVFSNSGERIMVLNAKELKHDLDKEKLILLSIIEVTSERRNARELQQKEKEVLLSQAKIASYKASYAYLQDVLQQAPANMCMSHGPNHIYVLANDMYMRLIGRRDVIGKPIREALPELEGQGFFEILDEVYKTGVSFTGNEMLAKLDKGNGKLEDCFFNFVYKATLDSDNNINGILTHAVEVTEQVHLRKKIEESEEQFRTLANNIQNLAWMADGSGWIYWYNQRWYEYTGTTLEEMKGWGWEKVHHPDHVNRIVEFVKEKWNINEPFELTFPLRGANGEYKWFLTRAFPISDSTGKVIRWIGTNTDIDEQIKQSEIIKESEERFRSLAQTLSQLVWVTDERGNAEFVSRRWEEYTGIEPTSEETWKAIVHPDDWGNMITLWMRSLSTGKPYEINLRLKSKSGEYRWHQGKGEAVFDNEGKIKKWVGAFTDLHILKEEQQRKDDFISIASHELKTPLTTIKAYGQIAEEMLEQGDISALGMLKKMGNHVIKLSKLIEELLDVTKMQKGKLTYNELLFDFNEVINETIDDMQKATITYKIITRIKASHKVFGDRDKISQVLNNLMSNAIKYSPKADKIIVSTKLENSGITLSVKDFGIGISSKEHKKIFEQFYRVSGHNQNTFPGLGIGLFICAEIIGRHGGKIWVESEISKGSIFHIWLPFDYRNMIQPES